MNDKKGLSDVVTTVLIILISIIAIVVLGSFLLPLVTKSGTNIEQAESCLTASLEVSSCKVTDTSANVTVKRNAGAASIGEIRLIFENPSGETSVVANSTVPEELGTKVYSKNLGFRAKGVSVAAGIADAKGNINYCNPTLSVKCN